MKINDIRCWQLVIFIATMGLLMTCFVCYFFFHFSIFPVAQAEILRMNSPDGKLDAVYVQSGAGAMTSGNYLVYIVPKDHHPNKKKDDAVFWGKRTFDLDVSWEDDRKLLIQFSKSDIKHFQSYIYPLPKDGMYRIDIILSSSKIHPGGRGYEFQINGGCPPSLKLRCDRQTTLRKLYP